MQIIIVGLRRAGTTEFWRTWRQDKRFVCYDEPFNELNRHVNDPDWWEKPFAGKEKEDLWERDPLTFWNYFAPIYRNEELKRGMSDHQEAFLSWLLGSAENVCTDLTRCHFKIADLKRIAPEAVLVHLRRPPQNWLTSIAFPSSTKLKWIKSRRERTMRRLTRSARNAVARRRFWTAQSGFGFHGYEEIMGVGPDSFFDFRIKEAGMDPEMVRGMPLVGRLLALWKLYGQEAEAAGANHFGDRFLSVNFNTFCKSPDTAIADVYERLGSEMPTFDFSGIHAPPSPFDPSARQWSEIFEELDIDRQWLTAGRES